MGLLQGGGGGLPRKTLPVYGRRKLRTVMSPNRNVPKEEEETPHLK